MPWSNIGATHYSGLLGLSDKGVQLKCWLSTIVAMLATVPNGMNHMIKLWAKTIYHLMYYLLISLHKCEDIYWNSLGSVKKNSKTKQQKIILTKLAVCSYWNRTKDEFRKINVRNLIWGKALKNNLSFQFHSYSFIILFGRYRDLLLHNNTQTSNYSVFFYAHCFGSNFNPLILITI